MKGGNLSFTMNKHRNLPVELVLCRGAGCVLFI